MTFESEVSAIFQSTGESTLRTLRSHFHHLNHAIHVRKMRNGLKWLDDGCRQKTWFYFVDVAVGKRSENKFRSLISVYIFRATASFIFNRRGVFLFMFTVVFWMAVGTLCFNVCVSVCLGVLYTYMCHFVL